MQIALLYAGILAFSTALAATPTTYYSGNLTAQVYPRQDGWSKEIAIKVYTFLNGLTGTVANGLDAAPIYLFRADSSVSSTPLQPNLIDVVPGDSGYSDLWNITIVTIKGSNSTSVANIDDLNTLVSSGTATLSYPGILVNCPVVHPNSTLEVASDGKTVVGYYKNLLVKYFDFGMNGANNGNNYLEPVWVITNTTGAQSGNHVFPGVNTDPGYTAFWYVDFVSAPAGYVANTWKSSSDFGSAKESVSSPLVIVNCPVVFVANATSENGTTTTTSSRSSATTTTSSIVWAFLGLTAVSFLV
ncbi:hypothetical protein HK100_001511 [Physocladia obscura]|uniref:Uncharacterized protein n=1 Tax=Physocladia obscura TaxID=109957 RepID=A0AAD5T9Z5_9FUNG|nr:hypothetical protein HK100_001511 [Physocladia obscura]